LEENLEGLLSLDRGLLEKAVTASCTIKARVVEKDEHEKDYRSVLNFGHTIGHALESLTRYEHYLHGEAVAIGMAQAACISRREGLCDDKTLERIHHLIKGTGLSTGLPSGIKLQELANKMEVDKKSVGGKIKFVLCTGIGKTQFHWLSTEEIITKLAPIQKKREGENR
jgi:3-dehydroquinate synthase